MFLAAKHSILYHSRRLLWMDPSCRPTIQKLMENSSLQPTLSPCHSAIEVSSDLIHPPLARYVLGCRIPVGAEMVVTSGQLGIAPDGHIPPDVESQTKIAIGNIALILQAAGGGLEHVVRWNAFVVDRIHLPGYMRVRDELMRHLPPTASTLMIVSGFSRPEFLVEVEAMAAIPPVKRSSMPTTNGVLNSSTRGFSTCTRKTSGGRWYVPSQATKLQVRGIQTESTNTSATIEACHELMDRGVQVIVASDSDDSRREVKRRSRDFYWYSPILKPQLRKCIADAVVLPRNEEEVIYACRAAAQHGVPVTARGAGTGNYGQAMPLQGGIVLDLSLMDEIEVDGSRGTFRAGPGAKLGDIEDLTREKGWELRQHPSTRQQATIGGFVAGGSTGHGALAHGGLSEDGAVLGLRVVTAETEPRVLKLKGRDVFPVVHAYGTNGIITGVEMPLSRAQPWTDVTVVFSSLISAATFSLEVSNAPAIVKRAVSVFQAPIPYRFLDADTMMHSPGYSFEEGTGSRLEPDDHHVSMVQCSDSCIDALRRLAIEHGGNVSRVLPSKEAPRPFYEFGWNHTTLHAIKKEKSTTYLQAVLPPDSALDLIAQINETFSDEELMQHLEVVDFQGKKSFASLALLWPSGEDQERKNDRLREILKWHEANGVPVFDPHTHVLEDGGMKETDWGQLGFKKKVDPSGILNPGKMRAWEEQAATIESSDPRGAFAAAYRLAETAGVGGGTTTHDEEVSRTTKPQRQRSRYWAEWSTADFATADLQEAVAVLPIGAVEAHGPHLPLGVDAMHNADILKRALTQLQRNTLVLALPPLDVGVSCEHSKFAGTLQVSAENAFSTWCDLGACVARAGIRKLVLYNSHGGNQALAEVVARRLRQEHGMLCVLWMNLSPGGDLKEIFPPEELRFGIHGGALETSLMLHLRPHLVSMDAAKDFPSQASSRKDSILQLHAPGFSSKIGWMSQDLNPHGVVGAAASQSDAAKGEKLAEACVRGLSQLLEELHSSDVDKILSRTSNYPPQRP